MNALKNRIIRLGLALAIVSALAILGTAPAMATNVVNGLIVTGGSITFTAVVGVGASAPVGGTGTSFTIPITVSDLRGSGAGWSLTATATPFTVTTPTPYTFPAGQTDFNAPSFPLCLIPTCTTPVNTGITYPLVVPDGASPTAVPFVHALAGSGQGLLSYTHSVAVTVPAIAPIGTYTSTMTISLVQAP